ncbi:type VII toxin-antitoxin system MntA family adenylyltransferase antitoxin [Sporosarcina obsidiansis]|uniref:type VII toxin-antitoxin system MntA family adenylyltransferase antitoxin n=1 Tax=Sporosarcina obsidiansis TaxID=2660748 RepID=UPI00129A3239|nr:nucleotidyltransferase domain-containing protein [Sporosarcina obsidiansis]
MNLNEAIRILQDEINPYFLILFGSFAKGTEHGESDVDLAYLAEGSLSAYDRFMLAQRIASALGKDVDLIDIRQATTVFVAQIFSEGTVIYCRDENTLAKERIKAFSMYAALNEQRAEILQDIKERGFIHDNGRNLQ